MGASRPVSAEGGKHAPPGPSEGARLLSRTFCNGRGPPLSPSPLPGSRNPSPEGRASHYKNGWSALLASRNILGWFLP